MSTINLTPESPLPLSPSVLPDHLQLPESDGKPVENFLEHFQAMLLSDSIWPVLESLHPDGQFSVGQNSGIYWRLTEPRLDGCKAPDWFYVPNVPPELKGTYRRSYVLWQEVVPPTTILEFASGDGSEERDRTPWKGKFWVYETVIRPVYYAIFLPDEPRIEMYVMNQGRLVSTKPNKDGRFSMPGMGGVQLGLWDGKFKGVTRSWMRWWGSDSQLLLTGDEREQMERQRAEQQRQRAEQEKQRAEKLAAKLRELGIDPDQE